MSRFGVGDTIWQAIIDVVSSYTDADRLILYGSRAEKRHHLGSDIDLAIDAPQMSAQAFAKLWNQLDDLPIVYSLDVVHRQAVTNPVLLSAIDSGIEIWAKSD